jgi:PAS domain S-box-containing protein
MDARTPDETVTTVEGDGEERRLEATLWLTIKTLFEQPTMAIGITDLDGYFVSINDAGKDLLGYPSGEDYAKRSVFEVVHPADRARVEALRAELLAGRIPRVHLEKRIVRGDGEMRWVNCDMAVVRPPLGGRSFIVVIGSDITPRKQEEEKAREREELLQAIFQLAPIGISITDAKDARYLRTNLRFRQMLGYSDHELAQLSGWDLVPPEEADANRILRDELFSGKRQDYTWERRYIRKDGSLLWAQNTVTLLRDERGAPRYVMALIEDISERRLKDAALRTNAEQLQALSRRLVEMQESERRDVARELHDRVGQTLTALRINLDMIRKRSGELGDSSIAARAEDSIELIESAFSSVESLLYELRPPMLEEDGVVAALEWHARAYEARTGIHVDITGEKACRCGPDVELALFRIAQEALNNVARHAKTSNVTIDLRDASCSVVLMIEDEGVGFDPQDPCASRGYGLTSMRERAQAVGGTLDIESVKEKGTVIIVTMPAR